MGPACSCFHSDTDEGAWIAEVLRHYLDGRREDLRRIDGLDDQDPRRFRRVGLRMLARALGDIVRQYGADHVAIDATGGYKAQIAVAVVVGQAMGVPVYYKHERFSEIISLPPLPVSFDLELWLRHSSLFYELDGLGDADEEELRERHPEVDWGARDGKLASLLDREEVDGCRLVALSPLGQAFHEAFRQRFREWVGPQLPPPAGKKFPPRFERAGWPGQCPEAVRFAERLTEEVPQVVRCTTFYYNRDLTERTHFRLRGEDIVCVFSTRGYTVKMRVETTARNRAAREAVVAALNEWLAG